MIQGGSLAAVVGATFWLYVHNIGFHPFYSVSCGSTETLKANYRVKVAGQLVVSSLISLRIVSFKTLHSFPLYTRRTPNTNFHTTE